MGYYIRVLSTGTEAVAVDIVERAVRDAGVSATLEVEDLVAHEHLLAEADPAAEGDETSDAPPPPTDARPPDDTDHERRVGREVDERQLRGWKFLLLRDASGRPIAEVERNPVVPRSLGEEELKELLREASEGEPASAAAWLERFLARVRTIYAIRILSGAEAPGGWDVVRAVQAALWRSAEGILQADAEGFTNTQGDHILWQFDHDVEGEQRMAVLDGDGSTWQPFTMELSDREARAAFLDGRVPPIRAAAQSTL